MILVKLEKLRDEAIVPSYAHEGDSGIDLYSCEDYILKPGERRVFPIGFKMEIPFGYEMQIRPRSGLAIKSGVTVLNSPGTVDACYRGEVGVILINHDNQNHEIKKGDKIAQGVFIEVQSAVFTLESSLSDTKRGSGGYGSTGR